MPRVIAIDGTFASGKGTLGKRLAKHYDMPYLDTGKLYRATAKAVLDAGGDVNDPKDGAKAAKALQLHQIKDPALNSGGIGAAASKVSVHTAVRVALYDFQRDFAAKGGIVDGRDIGTVICPDANVKLYIDAKADIRARRRYDELRGYGEDVTYEDVLAALHERDTRDKTRAEAPLKPANDAHLIDTSALDADAVEAIAIRIIDAAFTVS
ncbi:(d)CMP kinase [Litorimonas sp. RW-G-Af-16]|uniref:(d)CMP kinase n=1 Tax=Litorimonas sp. RW-G-Af-16 TaxID=3241168 RepID=UPI00390C4C96